MATAPNTSFIPKRGPVKRARQTASRQIHLLSIFSYVLFTATLVATVGVFFYSKHIDGQRRELVAEVNAAVESFNDAEMKRVLEFDSRLRQAQQRLNSTVAMSKIFDDALEQATVQSARVSRLEVTRQGDTQFDIEAEIEAESFDVALFQRGVYEKNPLIDSVKVSDVELLGSGAEEGTPLPGVMQAIKFRANLMIPLSAVPYTGGVMNENESLSQVSQVASSTGTSSSVTSGSEIGL